MVLPEGIAASTALETWVATLNFAIDGAMLTIQQTNADSHYSRAAAAGLLEQVHQKFLSLLNSVNDRRDTHIGTEDINQLRKRFSSVRGQVRRSRSQGRVVAVGVVVVALS